LITNCVTVSVEIKVLLSLWKKMGWFKESCQRSGRFKK
jgi:hypothetical protein